MTEPVGNTSSTRLAFNGHGAVYHLATHLSNIWAVEFFRAALIAIVILWINLAQNERLHSLEQSVSELRKAQARQVKQP